MAAKSETFDVYLEGGKKRTFAGALDWPGWCRRGNDEASALQALVEYGPRYARVLQGTRLGFHAPDDVSGLVVVERLQGNDATDFGAANIAPPQDAAPFGTDDLQRAQTILRAVWRAFDRAAEAATGQELSKGPRGGGRELDGIVRHLLDADSGYLSRVAQKVPKDKGPILHEALELTRKIMLEALEAGVRGEIPTHGPRGGALWTARYFVRRVAWHTLDHAWELEDRIVS